MSVSKHIFRPLYWLAGKIFSLWARPAVQPDNPAGLFADSDAPICYVLETGGLADTLALERLCRIHGLPSPTSSLEFCGLNESTRIIVLRRMRGFIFRRKRQRQSRRLERMVEASIEAGGQELLLVPVGIYWGRAPKKEQSWLTLLFSEHWDVAGRTRKFFTTVFQGRNTLLRYSHALPLSSIVQNGLEPDVAYRKVSRILRVHFRQRRVATVGPDLSHRRNLLNAVLADPSVRSAVDAEAGDDRVKRERATQKARKYANEIAAPNSYPTIRVVDRLLAWVWHRIYDGIEMQHVDAMHYVANHK